MFRTLDYFYLFGVFVAVVVAGTWSAPPAPHAYPSPLDFHTAALGSVPSRLLLMSGLTHFISCLAVFSLPCQGRPEISLTCPLERLWFLFDFFILLFFLLLLLNSLFLYL